MAKKAVNVHEAFASFLAFENCILWDAYTPSQFPLFKEKLCKLYQNVGRCSLETMEAMNKTREAVYKSTVAQAKYTNKNLLSTFILVTVAKGDTFLKARDATNFSVHLVVRTRKCFKNDDSTKCCMVFIDEQGRVYKNWKSYIEDNLLPEGIALAPSRGCYTYENGKLCLESWPTPASTSGRKIVATTDFAAGAGALTSVGISLATLALPVSAPLIAAASFLGVSTGVYTALRSGFQLMDRSEHGQSIGLTDTNSRKCWLGVTTGTLAASSSVANKVITRVSGAGRKFTLLEQSVVKGMNVATILASGTGVINGVIYIIIKLSDDQETTATDWFEIISFLAIFTHSIYNYRTASNIMSKSRHLRTTSFKNELRGMSEKIFKSKTSSFGKFDLIRLTNAIPHCLLNEYYGSVINLVKHNVLSKEKLSDCIQFLCLKVGEIVTKYLVNKTNQFLEKFRLEVEKNIKTTLFFEIALWDLYQKCENHLKNITIQNLDANIQLLFRLLLEHYKKMAWKPNGSVYKCGVCDGFYGITE